LTDDAGRVGVGEAAPLPGFGPETFDEVVTALHGFFGQARMQQLPSDVPSLRAFMAANDDPPASVRHAVEQALLDLLAQRAAIPLTRLLSDREPRATLPMHRVISSPETASAAVADGLRTLKIKVGVEALTTEVARIAAIRAAVGPDIALRLDANGAWDTELATASLERFASHGIQSIEQPVPADDLAGLATLRAHFADIDILADESCRTLEDVDRLLAANAVDGFVIKPMLAGGLLPVLDMSQRAVDAKLPVSITSSIDSAIARSAARQVASIVPGELLSCGLDTGPLLARDLVPRSEVPQ
ncbi:MAG: mandelate racemase/muconate lactonizing enzyme family protein, partial [Planctomycetota bacterium]